MSNVPIISSSVVAILSILLSFTKLFFENYTGSRRVKRLTDLVVLSKNIERSNSKRIANDIISIELKEIRNSLTRKVNKANIAIVITISLLGGLISYALALWAINSGIVLSIIAWILFVAVAVMTVGLAITGLSKAYEQETNDKDVKK